MRLSVITKYIGLSLLIVATFMFVSAAVSAVNGFDDSFIPLLYSGIITSILGAYPSIFVRKTDRITRQEGQFIVVGAWVVSCVMGMLPYFLIGNHFSLVDSFFESVSGFTTTGASIVDDIESLPRGLLFWRMSTSWIGGIGIVVLFSLVMPNRYGKDDILAGSELSDMARSSSNMGSRSFVSMMAVTYVVLTIAATISLLLCGMGWFDAVTHAMSACSTCGFSTRNSSIASFSSISVEIVLIVFMTLASLRFALLSGCLAKGGIRKLLESQVTRFFLGFMSVAALVLTLSLFANEEGSFFHCLRMGAFQTASIFTTTGFATEDTSVWSPMCRSIIILGSFACGCSGSTSGGFKADRLLAAWNVLGLRVRQLHAPNSVQRVFVEGKAMRDASSLAIFTFILAYFVIICLGGLFNLSAGMECTEAWTAAVASIGNVGPGMGSIGSMSNFADIPTGAKYSSMILMLIGRLEIFPALYVLTWRLRKQ